MLINRIFVVLIELHEAPYTTKGRDQFFQNPSLMHQRQGFGNRLGARQQFPKPPAHGRGSKQVVRYAFHVAVNLFQHQAINRHPLFLSNLKETQEMLRIIQDLHEFFIMDGQPPINDLKEAVDHGRRPQFFETSP